MIRSWIKAIAGIVVGLGLIRASKPGGWPALYTLFWVALGVMVAFAIGVVVAFRRISRPPMEWEDDDADYQAYYQDEEDIPGLERHFRAPGTAAPGMPGMWRGGARLVGRQITSDVAFFAGKAVAGGTAIHARGARVARFFFDGLPRGNTHQGTRIGGSDRDGTGGRGHHGPRET